MDALEPLISTSTLELHYGKHHQTYVTKLNELIAGSEFENKTLEEIIRTSTGPTFNNAAQIWNHTFYWNCLRSPNSENTPTDVLQAKITQQRGSFEKFREIFSTSALTNF
jgi:Fe-Mn family superoxide dismutase